MNFFNQGIPLGRWFRINVILHWTFLLYALNSFMHTDNIGANALFMVLLFGTVLLHEFGHALSCRAVGGQADQIILWPLGGIAFVQPPMNPWAWLITTVCGPLVNAILWPVFWLITYKILLPYVADHGATHFQLYVLNACDALWQINRGLLLFNLIPAYPMDGGRILQELLWFTIGYKNSLQVAGMVGVVAGLAFIVVGFGWHLQIPQINLDVGGYTNILLCVIGLLCAMASMNIYRQAETISSWRKR